MLFTSLGFSGGGALRSAATFTRSDETPSLENVIRSFKTRWFSPTTETMKIYSSLDVEDDLFLVLSAVPFAGLTDCTPSASVSATTVLPSTSWWLIVSCLRSFFLIFRQTAVCEVGFFSNMKLLELFRDINRPLGTPVSMGEEAKSERYI